MQQLLKGRERGLGHVGQMSLSVPDLHSSDPGKQGVEFLPSVAVLQRMPAPWQCNVPLRLMETPSPCKDELEPLPATLPGGKPQLRRLTDTQPLPSCKEFRIQRKALQSIHGRASYTSLMAKCNQTVSDRKMLIESAERYGHPEAAARAYHTMAVALDNAGKYKEAMKPYKKFLEFSRKSGDKEGEALSCNCLGINAHKLGMYDRAIQYHTKHLELVETAAGQLQAHTNLGITYQAMGLSQHAAVHHHLAIKLANLVGAKNAQCSAVGNLGVSAAQHGDFQTAQMCLQHHRDMGHAVRGKSQIQPIHMGNANFAEHMTRQVENDLHHQLGQLNASQGKQDEASSHFARAVEVARNNGDQKSEERSCVLLGIAQGLTRLKAPDNRAGPAANESPASTKHSDDA